MARMQISLVVEVDDATATEEVAHKLAEYAETLEGCSFADVMFIDDTDEELPETDERA